MRSEVAAEVQKATSLSLPNRVTVWAIRLALLLLVLQVPAVVEQTAVSQVVVIIKDVVKLVSPT